eukprot:196968-Prorocentrum_minimum.AAC.1
MRGRGGAHLEHGAQRAERAGDTADLAAHLSPRHSLPRQEGRTSCCPRGRNNGEKVCPGRRLRPGSPDVARVRAAGLSLEGV